MPTSISHLGGRARVNEPGRYRKKNNKNLTAQGLPTYVGMPQPLRNLIAKRVKPSQAVAKKKPSIKTIRINETDSLFITSAITLTDSGGGKVLLPGIRGQPQVAFPFSLPSPDDYDTNENQQILIQSPVGSKISITGKYCVESSLQDADPNGPQVNTNAGFYDFIKIYDSKQSYSADGYRDEELPTPDATNAPGLLWFSSAQINTEDANKTSGTQLSPAAELNFYFPIRTINKTSTSNQIYVHFKSDGIIVASGFDFQLNIV
jgi:hypothetical protein